MLGWFRRHKPPKLVESDLVDALQLLNNLKFKLQDEGPRATLIYADGVGQVARLLSQQFGVSVPDALAARGLDWKQLEGASRYLMADAKKAGSMLGKDLHVTRTAAHGHSFGCLVLYYLYRLKFLAEKAPETHQRRAAELANRYAEFARLMGEIAIGYRTPAEAYE